MQKIKNHWQHLFILCLISLTIYGCSKEFDEKLAPSETIIQAETIKLLKKSFFDNGYHSKLYDKLNENSTINWEPNWPEVSKKVKSTEIEYFYIPLTPKLQSNKTGEKQNFQMVNIKRYLIIKRFDSKLTFKLATYDFEELNFNNNANNQSLRGSFSFNFFELGA